MSHYQSVILIILDGWGLSPSWGGNALTMNNPKNIDGFWRNYPHLVLQALSKINPKGFPVIAESRLGHTMIGTGRQVKSTYSRIQAEIENHSFEKNEAILGAINWAKVNNSNLHLVGLISEGGVHSHLDHLLAILNLAARENFKRVFVDAITDGTDSDSTDALRFIEKIEHKMHNLRLGEFSSVCGRFFAMDRDKHFDRTSRYYKMLVEGKGDFKNNIVEAVTSSYKKGLNDEFIEPTLLTTRGGRHVKIEKGDAIIFFNYRSDRTRQLTDFFVNDKFRPGIFKPKRVEDLYFATFTDYKENLPLKIAFPDEEYPNSLSEILSRHALKQLKIAESEKQSHVTTFFDGTNVEAFPGEERKILSSPEVTSYDLKPEMSAQAVTKSAVRAVKSKKYDFILINFANVDMVAHTGNILAVGQAVQIIDHCVKSICEAGLKANAVTMITADHGNAEQMVSFKKSGQTDHETMHTLNPVPFIFVAPDRQKNLVSSSFSSGYQALAKIIEAKNDLADIAPTILDILKIPKPKEMTGRSLLSLLE